MNLMRVAGSANLATSPTTQEIGDSEHSQIQKAVKNFECLKPLEEKVDRERPSVEERREAAAGDRARSRRRWARGSQSERQGYQRVPIISEAATAAEGTVLEGPKVSNMPTRKFRVSKRVSALVAQIIINNQPRDCPLVPQ